MSNFQEYLIVLKASTKDQNFQTQTQIILQLINCIERSSNKENDIRNILRMNFGEALNDVISSQLTVLIPTLKLIRHLMTNLQFRNYQFLNIFKNILRVLILLVQSDKMEKSQLDFFQVVDYLDILLKKYLSKKSSRREDEDHLQIIFVCLLKFIELVTSEKSMSKSIKILVMEIYICLLNLIKKHKCSFKNFQLIMRVSNLADVFLDYLCEKYHKEPDELWLFKITEILFRLLESCNDSDTLQVKCFEKVFYGWITFVLEQIMIQNSSNPNLELFKFCISIINVILWTPSFSESFCTKIIKKIIKLKADSIIFILAKSSRKIRKHSQYSMKIFLSALIIHSGSSINKHLILDIFLEARFSKSLSDLKVSEIVNNRKLLILLYGCSFLKHQLRSPLSANKVLENLAIILLNLEGNIDDHEIWIILRTFSYYSNYAVVSALEYIGVQEISALLLTKTSEFLIDKERMQYPIDKYIISYAKNFSPNTKIINTMILAYISQKPTESNSKIGNIVPTTEVLPFIFSNDYNQVVNAVMILQQKHLREEDLDFIVKHCFSNLKSEGIIIEGAYYLINKNCKTISAASAKQVFEVTLAFLEFKQVAPKYSMQCKFLMMTTCVNLVRFGSNINLNFEPPPSKHYF